MKYVVYYKIEPHGQIEVEATTASAAKKKVQEMGCFDLRLDGQENEEELEIADIFEPADNCFHTADPEED